MRGRRATLVIVCFLNLCLAAVADAGVPTCFGRSATIVGTGEDDEIEGTSGNDVIYGGQGADELVGLGGNDLACGGPGTDFIAGGKGNDKLGGGSEDDVLLDGGGGSDVLIGGRGNDDLEDWDANLRYGNEYDGQGFEPTPVIYFDHLAGGAGDDDIRSVYGPDEIDAGEGTDECLVDRRSSPAGCEDRTNWIAWWNTRTPRYPPHCLGKNPTLIGTRYPDYFDQAPGDNVMLGRGGDDVLTVNWYYSATDTMCGGQGDDEIASYAGNERLSGGPGDDSLTPGYGDDLIYGGAGDDWTEDWEEGAVSGDDIWFMGDGADHVTVEDGEDVVFGGAGADTIADLWTCEHTVLHGNSGDDVIDAYADWDSYDGGPCTDPPDDVYGDEGTDQAKVNANDNVYGVEVVNISSPPEGD